SGVQTCALPISERIEAERIEAERIEAERIEGIVDLKALEDAKLVEFIDPPLAENAEKTGDSSVSPINNIRGTVLETLKEIAHEIKEEQLLHKKELEEAKRKMEEVRHSAVNMVEEASSGKLFSEEAQIFGQNSSIKVPPLPKLSAAEFLTNVLEEQKRPKAPAVKPNIPSELELLPLDDPYFGHFSVQDSMRSRWDSSFATANRSQPVSNVSQASHLSAHGHDDDYPVLTDVIEGDDSLFN
ncbi:MAG: hypothetical protein LBS40_00645, partial [Burkholderiales bacterium]|nr:hypothetical protein [Burkholderiales bacterium]